MPVERKAYTVPEIARMLHIGRGKAYELCRSDGFPAIRIGEKRIVVPCDAFERWLSEAAARKE